MTAINESQSPAGAQLDSDFDIGLSAAERIHEMSQSPAGAQLDFDLTHSVGWVRFLRKGLSQSPAGAQLDFHLFLSRPLRLWLELCRNPPQGLSSISTPARDRSTVDENDVAIPRRVSSISTCPQGGL